MSNLLVNNPNWQAYASGLEADRGLAPGLLSAVLKNETGGGHPDIINATSTAGAKGAFQFMDGTAKQYNVNVADHADSTRGAADFLGDLTKKYSDPLLAGAAYNWGPGNLDKALKAAAGAGIPTDALSLANHGFLPKETSGYVVKLASNLQSNPPSETRFSPDVINSTRSTVIQLMQSGVAPASIVQQLGKSPVAPMIDKLTVAGLSADEIIDQVGGQALQKVKAVQAQVSAQGFGTNLVKGAANAAQDVSTGAQQIGATITGNDGRLQQLNTEEAARQADPAYQAQGNTVGSMIGGGAVKALPYVAAAMIPELSVPGMIATQGAVGAMSGALKPTTGDGQRLGNIGAETAMAAGGAGAGALIGKGGTALAGKMLGGSTEDAARVAGLTADARAQGLPVNAATLSKPDGFWRGIGDSMPNNGSVQAFQAKADQAIASKVADGLGLPGYEGPINTELLQAASPGIKAGLDNATNVSVVLPRTLQADLAPMVNGSTNPLTQGIASNSVVKQAVTNLLKVAESGTPVAGRALQELNSELKALIQSQGVSASERQMAGQLIGKINTTLTDAMTPEQAAAFKAANSQYANLKAVEKMVSSSGDTGIVTPRQMINAVKNGRFKSAFYAGDAPYQDLAGTAADLYGPSAGKGLGSMMAKATGSHDEGFAAGAILHPHVGIPALAAKKIASALLGKLASSENPTIVRLLSGGKGIDPATAAFIAKALGNAGAVTAQ
jgi:hypothetical protein